MSNTFRSRRWAGPLLLAGALLGVAGCGEGPAVEYTATLPARPEAGQVVPPGSELQRVIEAASAGATLLLQPGDYRGPVRIEKPLTIWGPPSAIVRSDEGTTVRVASDDVALLGFTVSGSGRRFDLMDGGVHLTGKGIRVEGVTVEGSLFGILVERCREVILRGNRVVGSGGAAMGLRGDGIRLWETEDSLIEDNVVTGARDMVVWYSSNNELRRNTILGSRYGTHFMYSHHCLVEDCRYVDNEVGIFVMYSRDLVVRRSLLARARGAAGLGIGFKESGNVTIEDNWLLDNTIGIYADNSPLNPTHRITYARNVFRFSEIAVSLHTGVERTRFVDNQFRDNGAVVKVGGHDDALECEFVGNYFDTYVGYDFDGDGHGDVPYEFRRLSTQLEGRWPHLALLHGTPAMGMVDLVGELMPLFQPRKLVIDESPRMKPLAMTWRPEDRYAR